MTTSLRSIPRRAVLGGIAVSGAMLALPGMAHAKMPMGQPQAPYFYRFKLGDAECTIVSDGQLPLGDPSAAFQNITKEEIAAGAARQLLARRQRRAGAERARRQLRRPGSAVRHGHGHRRVVR